MRKYWGRRCLHSNGKILSNATFTLLRFYTKTERKRFGFLKPLHYPHTETHRNGHFRKRSFKWIFTRTEVFKNTLDLCERTETDKKKNGSTATTLIQNNWRQFRSEQSLEKMENGRTVLCLLTNLAASIHCLSMILQIVSHLYQLHQARRKKCSIVMNHKSFVWSHRAIKKLLVPLRFWVRPGLTNLWWKNLINSRMVDKE